MRERSIDETRDLLQRVVAEMNAPFRRYDFAGAEAVYEPMAGQYIEFDYRLRHWVDAVIALKDAAINVYGVLSVETDPGMQGGIATFDEATSHVR